MQLSVLPNDNGSRLDKFLTAQLTNTTRSQIKKLIQQQAVLVNGQGASVHKFLKTGDVVTVTEPKPTATNVPKPAPAVAEAVLEPTVIFETPDYAILNKPAGLLVHPTAAQEPHTLAAWLRSRYPDIAEVGDESHRAGIVHRLDRDVSGVMIIAKTKTMFTYLKKMFKARRMRKEYIALVYGHMQQPTGEINLPIGRNKDGQFVAHPTTDGKKYQSADRVAKTRYQVIEYVKDYTLLRVQILTGRTHQIRAHLSAIGHPIIGDVIYQPKKKIFHFLRRRIKVISCPRIFLHATHLSFALPTKQRVTYDAALPEELNTFLQTLKQ